METDSAEASDGDPDGSEPLDRDRTIEWPDWSLNWSDWWIDRSDWSLDRPDWSYLAALLTVGSYVYLVDLGEYTLAGWDEGVYATAAYHAVADGHWLVPQTFWIANTHDVALTPFLHKPPLVVWLQAVSMSVFGVDTFGARLPSALAAILTGAVIYAAGRRHLTRLAGFLGGVVWYTTPAIYAATNGGRFAATDTVHVLFGSLFVLFAWTAVAEDRPALVVPTCIAGALTVLSKGFAAGIFVLIVLPLVLARPGLLRTRATARGLLAALALVLPWPVLVTARYGDAFVQQALVEQVIGRASGSVGVSTGGGVFSFMRYPYFRHFFSLFDPWVYWLLPGVVALAAVGVRRSDPVRLRTVGFLTYWAGVVIAFFALVGNHQWYLMPMYVPCALLVGWLFDEVADWSGPALWALLVGAVLFVGFSPRFGALSPLAANRFDGLHGGAWSSLTSGRAAAVLLLVFVAVLLAVRPVRSGRVDVPSRAAVAGVAPVVLAVVLVVAFVTPPASMGTLLHNQSEMGEVVRDEVPAGETVYVQTTVPDATNLFPYEFYSRRDAASASRYELYTDDSIRYAVVTRATLETLRRPHEVLIERSIQSGRGPKPLAVVKFTGSFASYRPRGVVVNDTSPNLLENPSFARGLADWWIPSGNGTSVVREARVGGQPAALLSVPAGATRLPLAQRVRVRDGARYRVDVNASGEVDVALLWYDGPKRPSNLVARRTVTGAGLSTTMTARGDQLSVRIRPAGDRAVVFGASVRRAARPIDRHRLGPETVRNADFADGLAEWWANPDAEGTQVSVAGGTVTMRTPPGESPLPIGQRVVVDPTKRYVAEVVASAFADLVLVWFADGDRTDPVGRTVVPVSETPTVVEPETHLVAVRVRPAGSNVTVSGVSLRRVVTGNESAPAGS